MKGNCKYTALEILKEAGIKEPEKVFGKMRVVIGGIHGINTPDRVIKISKGTKEISVLVGKDIKKIKIEGDDKEGAISEEAHKVKEAKGHKPIKEKIVKRP